MITLLSRFILKDNMSDDEKRSAYGKITGLVGIILNLILFIIKLASGLITGSISIMADAFNNLSDCGSCAVTLVGFRLASEKADPEHPFGHGRIEYIAGFVVSTMILIMSVELIRESVMRIAFPRQTEFSWLVNGLLLLSIGVKLYMWFFYHSVGKKIDSPAIIAQSFDSLSDCLATLAVVATSIISKYTGFIYLDGLAGLAVGIFILIEGIGSAKDTLNPLLGKAPDPELIKEIRNIMLHQNKNITGMHDLIIHDYGPGRIIISLHAEVPADGNILELHDIIDNAERELEKKLHCTATIHMDPIVTDDPKVLKIKSRVESILQTISPSLSMHDFRVVPGKTHTNLVFDVLMPFGFSMTESELKNEVQKAVTTDIGNKYFCVIHFDTDYSVVTVKEKKH